MCNPEAVPRLEIHAILTWSGNGVSISRGVAQGVGGHAHKMLHAEAGDVAVQILCPESRFSR